MFIYKTQSKNFDVRSEGAFTIGFYSTKEKAVKAAVEYIKQKEGTSNFELLPENFDKFRSYEHIEYVSHYGSYSCGVEIVPIEVQ